MPIEYLKRILNAHVYEVAEETPLDPLPALSTRLGNRVLLKREDMQPVFSFKVRGAYNKMAQLSEAERARGVIAASAGNHAQGVALSARRLGCRAVIVMPITTPQLKIDAVRARGGEVVLYGESFTDAYQHALALQSSEGLTFVHPFDDPDVIAGQGTIGMELMRQHPAPVDAIFMAIGGGGLAAGVAAYVKAIRPETKIIGVETVDADAMRQSLAAGRPVTLDDVGLFSDGTAVKRVGDETFALCQRYLDDIILVNTDQICAALKDAFEDTRAILEPAGGQALAGLKAWVQREGCKDRTLMAVASGANMNFDRMRFVSERAEIGEAREAVFAVTIPEKPGSFLHFCRQIGARNVTEFNYRIADSQQAHIYVGVEVSRRADIDEMAQRFRDAGFPTMDLTDDELAKTHLRHLVGGRSALAQNEVLYRFEFPERPGALMRFLEHLAPSWNISLFHYRNHGSDFGRTLVGIQVPPQDRPQYEHFLAGLGYRYWNESDNPAYHLFLTDPAANKVTSPLVHGEAPH
ncbi:MAG: threonine ammonia-lyase, biosynthetic [Lautropia sp.]|nr:threonine ammonia-lyase, biosynthetic [Lautropia sp.]